jgi:hypothetical protein
MPFRNTVKFLQITFGLVPVALNAVDAVFAGGEQFRGIDSQMADYKL